jgi:Rho-binding antiterminator
MPGSYRPLACALHDYLEIACLHHYRLRIELDDSSWLEARAPEPVRCPARRSSY